MSKIKVTTKFIEKSLDMANDLYGLADLNGSTEVKKMLRPYIKQCKKLLGVEQES